MMPTKHNLTVDISETIDFRELKRICLQLSKIEGVTWKLRMYGLPNILVYEKVKMKNNSSQQEIGCASNPTKLSTDNLPSEISIVETTT